MATISTVDGDTADQVALRAYGFTAAATEALMAANPQLAGYDAVLPAGLILDLPSVAAPQAADIIQLWD